MYGVIYVLTNLVNGKKYVGQTTMTLRERLTTHKYQSKRGKYPINRAIRKYGIGSFIIEEISSHDDQSSLNDGEIKYIEMFDTTNATKGYNISIGGNGVGKHSDDTKRKMSISNKKYFLLYGSRWLGCKHSEESKQIMREKATGRLVTNETKEKLRSISLERFSIKENHPMYGVKGIENPRYGMFQSDETKSKISKANSGKKHGPRTEKWKQDMSIRMSGENNPMYGKSSWSGKHHTEDTKEKLRSSKEGNMKSMTVTFPDGKVMVVKGVRKFCKDNDLNYIMVGKVLKGVWKHHKGYIFKYLD